MTTPALVVLLVVVSLLHWDYRVTDGYGESAQSCTYGDWLKVHVKCTGIFSFATNVDDSCVLKRALIPSHDITFDPRYSLDLTIKFLQHHSDPTTPPSLAHGTVRCATWVGAGLYETIASGV